MRQIDNPNFDILSIRDGLALPAMMNGAVGFESGVANFFPELTKAFHELVLQGNYQDAMVLQDRMHQLRDISHQFGRNVPTLHGLVSMRGLDTGVPKKPFYLLSEDENEKLWQDLQALDFDVPLKQQP
jgi:dihydrodipicolinate synthase/N-acetylneuraminate lyase